MPEQNLAAELFAAIKNNKLEEIKELVKHEIDFNQLTEDPEDSVKKYFLDLAVELGGNEYRNQALNNEQIKVLLEVLIDSIPKISLEHAATGLHEAFFQSTELSLFLLEKLELKLGKKLIRDIILSEIFSENLEDRSYQFKVIEVIKKMLEYIEINDIFPKNRLTLLHLAASVDAPDEVYKFLFQQGADINLVNDCKHTPLDEAIDSTWRVGEEQKLIRFCQLLFNKKIYKGEIENLTILNAYHKILENKLLYKDKNESYDLAIDLMKKYLENEQPKEITNKSKRKNSAEFWQDSSEPKKQKVEEKQEEQTSDTTVEVPRLK